VLFRSINCLRINNRQENVEKMAKETLKAEVIYIGVRDSRTAY